MNGARAGYEINIKEFKKLLDKIELKQWESQQDKKETVNLINEFINEHGLLNQVLKIEGGGGLGAEIITFIDKLVPPKSQQKGKKNKSLNSGKEPRNILKGTFGWEETTRKNTKRKTLDEEFEEIDKMWDDFDDRVELI